MNKKKITIIISAAIVAVIAIVLLVTLPPAQQNDLGGSDASAPASPVSPGQVQNPAQPPESLSLADEIMVRYAQTESKYVFTEPLLNMAKNQVFRYELDFVPDDEDLWVSDIVSVFLDASLTLEVSYSLHSASQAGDIITIAPPMMPNLLPHGLTGQYWQTWGYAPRYYIAAYVSPSGEPYRKPVVTMFTVENDLSAPNVNYYFSDGHLGLEWDRVPGAEEYVICIAEMWYDEDSNRYSVGSTDILAITSDTDYLYRDKRDSEFYANGELDRIYPYFLYVLARNGDVFSSMSDPIYSKNILPFLPRAISGDDDTDDDTVGVFSDTINELAFFQRVEMLDDSIVLMPVSYDIENAGLRRWVIAGRGHVDLLSIPYRVLGTPFQSSVNITGHNRDTIYRELEMLKEREAQAHMSTGLLKPDFRTGVDIEHDLPQFHVSVEGFNIFATNAFSEYLAINMLNGVELIDISGFDERFDVRAVAAAYFEAFYQNPLILETKPPDASINASMTQLLVEYEENQTDRQRKQNELKREVTRVVGQIIKPGMSDLEKQLAINYYLCETAEYDNAALANGEANNFKFVDPSFNDSFTAYGILMKGVGVCAGYAAAFKLLADEAGLQSIVVTGMAYGYLPHAWNRVFVEGEWMTMDSTWNDNDTMPNFIFNIPDRISSLTHVEDGNNIMADAADIFTGQHEDFEYYRLSGNFYSMYEIADMLLSDLKHYNRATLRTDYELDDRQFIDIAFDVLEKGGWDISDFDGYYQLGVIFLFLR